MNAWYFAGLGRRAACSICTFLLAISTVATAQTVVIGAGDRWQADDAIIDLGCAALNVDGALDAEDAQIRGIHHLSISGQITAESAAIAVGGDWTNQGSFVPGLSTVVLSDRCDEAASLVAGSNAFSTLRIESARGKSYALEAGQTQSVVAAFQLVGIAGNYLSLRSTQSGAQTHIALSDGGSQSIFGVDVADMSAPIGFAWLARGTPGSHASIDSGNNFRWFEAPAPTQLPAASFWSLLALIVGLSAAAMRRAQIR